MALDVVGDERALGHDRPTRAPHRFEGGAGQAAAVAVALVGRVDHGVGEHHPLGARLVLGVADEVIAQLQLEAGSARVVDHLHVLRRPRHRPGPYPPYRGSVPGSIADVAVARPTAALRPFVGRYTGYRLEGFPPGVHRGLPSGWLTFIVSLGDPVRITSMPDRQHPPAVLAAFVSGLHAGPAAIAHDGDQAGVSLDLSPLGARALLGLPAGALAGQVVGLEDLLGAGVASLPDRLASAPTWVERFAILDDVLLAAADRATVRPRPRPEVVEAWRRLLAAGGTLEVGALAAGLGWSRRHLGEHFRTELGLAPKAAARVVRFDRARRLLERPDRRGLADVAASVGYFDQAHLTREWRALAGCTPTEWLIDEVLPSVQDATVDEGAA